MASGLKLLEIPLNWDITEDDANELLYSLLQKDLRNYFPETIEVFFQSPHKWILVDFLRELQFLASSSDFLFTIKTFFSSPTLIEMYNLAKKYTTYDSNTGVDSILSTKSLDKKTSFIFTSLIVLNESITAITNGGYPFTPFKGKYQPAILFYFYEESTPTKYRGHIFIQETELFTKKIDSLLFISIYKSNLAVTKQSGFADYVLEAVQKKTKQLNKEYVWTIPLPSMMPSLKEKGFTPGAGSSVHDVIIPLSIYWKKLNTTVKRNPFSFWKGGSKRTRKGVLKRKSKTRKSK